MNDLVFIPLTVDGVRVMSPIENVQKKNYEEKAHSLCDL